MVKHPVSKMFGFLIRSCLADAEYCEREGFVRGARVCRWLASRFLRIGLSSLLWGERLRVAIAVVVSLPVWAMVFVSGGFDLVAWLVHQTFKMLSLPFSWGVRAIDPEHPHRLERVRDRLVAWVAN